MIECRHDALKFIFSKFCIFVVGTHQQRSHPLPIFFVVLWAIQVTPEKKSD